MRKMGPTFRKRVFAKKPVSKFTILYRIHCCLGHKKWGIILLGWIGWSQLLRVGAAEGSRAANSICIHAEQIRFKWVRGERCLAGGEGERVSSRRLRRDSSSLKTRPSMELGSWILMASLVAEFSASVGLTITGSEVIDSVRVRGAMEVAILVDVLFFSI